MSNLFDPDFILERDLVFIGSPETVTRKLRKAARGGRVQCLPRRIQLHRSAGGRCDAIDQAVRRKSDARPCAITSRSDGVQDFDCGRGLGRIDRGVVPDESRPRGRSLPRAKTGRDRRRHPDQRQRPACAARSWARARNWRGRRAPGPYVFRLFDRGEEIQHFSLSEEHERKHGAPYTQLHRADFHEILAARRKNSSRTWSGSTSGSRDTSKMKTESRCTLQTAPPPTGDLLVAADGLKSAIRGQMLGAAVAVYTGDGAWRIIVPIERFSAEGISRAYVGVHRARVGTWFVITCARRPSQFRRSR